MRFITKLYALKRRRCRQTPQATAANVERATTGGSGAELALMCLIIIHIIRVTHEIPVRVVDAVVRVYAVHSTYERMMVSDACTRIGVAKTCGIATKRRGGLVLLLDERYKGREGLMWNQGGGWRSNGL